MRSQESHERAGGGGGRRRGEERSGGQREGRGEERGEVSPASSPLPVFLFPSQLMFYSNQRSSHRRVLTLYNPYTFPLTFKMLCTAPSLYRVVEAEGSVRAKSCVDLVVRHQDVSPRNWGRRDRFRMDVRGGGQTGGREIWAELRGGEEGGEDEEERRKRGGAEEKRRPLSPLLVPTQQTQGCLPSVASSAMRSPSQFAVCVVVGVVCVTVLMLPLQSEPSTMVPRYLHVSATQKLVCAYILGLLTMVFLR